jgi:soluble lytic murein transglycosylase-like protein
VFVGKVIKEGKQTVATGGPRGFQEALSQRMGVAEVLYKEGDLSQLQSTLDDLQRFDDVKSLAKQSALGGSPTNLWSTVLGALKDPGGFIKMVSKAGTAVSTGSALYTVANLWKGDLPKVAKGIVSLVGGAGMSALAKTRADQLAKAEAMIFANPKLLEAALAPPTEENVQRFIKSLEAMGVLTAKAGANTTREESKQNAAAQEPAKPIASMEPKATGAQTNSEALLKEIMDMAIPSAGAEERQPTAASTTVKGTNVSLPTGQSYAPPSLVKAVIQAESRGRPYAVSKKGAGGLMQLMPQTAKALGINPADRFDPQTNVEAGSRYLKQMLDRFGSYELALAAYNFGPTAVAKRLKAVEQDNKKPTWNNIKHLVPAETRAYVANVTKNIG